MNKKKEDDIKIIKNPWLSCSYSDIHNVYSLSPPDFSFIPYTCEAIYENKEEKDYREKREKILNDPKSTTLELLSVYKKPKEGLFSFFNKIDLGNWHV
jgi:hypothetical protein